MTCDEARAAILAPQDQPQEALRAHLSGCALCRRLAAAMPSLPTHPEPPLGLVESTMRRVGEQASRPPVFWLDRLVNSLVGWLFQDGPGRGAWGAALTTCLLVGLVLSPHWARSRAQGVRAACETNLKALSVSLEHYRQEHHGTLPDDWGQLPLKNRPECPASGAFSYELRLSPDRTGYTITCRGHGSDPDPPHLSHRR